MKVINDASHGGSDPGAIGFNQTEKEWTLEASNHVNKRLNELGIQSTQTRTKDVALSSKERTDIVKASKAEICLSHHFNAFLGKGEGVETIHSIHTDGAVATKIAYAIRDVGQKFRRVFSRKGTSGDYYYMHRLTGATKTIIIEYGFIDNATDYAKMKSKAYREKMYEAVVKVMCDYFKVSYKPIQVPKPISEGKLFKVQVGAFGDVKNAERLAKELKGKGYATYIVEE